MRTTTATATRAATTAKPTSTPLVRDPPPPDRAGACRGAAAGAGRCAVAWAADGAGGAAVAGAAIGAAGAGVAVATVEGAGILMVGDAVGLGGKLMRTVSFFGCTL